MSVNELEVVLRRRWNDPESARARIGQLRDLKVRSDPGGVCSPVPRPFIYARIWCDHLTGGARLHACNPITAPHDLELCVLEADNSSGVYAAVKLRLGR